jgi:hypothetical protein
MPARPVVPGRQFDDRRLIEVSSEGTCRRRIERQRIEIGLGLLQDRLPRGRSSSELATRGPTDSSANVIVEISGIAGSADASLSRGRLITVLVSSKPADSGTVTTTNPTPRQDRPGTPRSRSQAPTAIASTTYPP